MRTPLLLVFQALALAALLRVGSSYAEDQLEVIGVIDGTDQITITQDAAVWKHLFGNLSITSVSLNGVPWKPSQFLTLQNSGATAFLTNKIDFMSARLELIQSRDTVVLQPEPQRIIISIADTPNGTANYHFIVHFPAVPTMTIEADIDGSDELHISYAGARWFHRQWGWPTAVTINGVPWNPATSPFLTNAAGTTFLAEPVHFANAVVISSSSRDLLTVRTADDGVIINFADNPVGASPNEVVIAFPPGNPSLNASLTAISKASISASTANGIEIDTLRGVWYELQSISDLNANSWSSTGAFLRGNGTKMKIFDPLPQGATQYYRILSRDIP